VAPPATTLAAATRATEQATTQPTARGRAGAAPSATPAAPAGGAAAAGSDDAIPFVAVAQADTGRYRGTRARAIVAASALDWGRMVAPLLPRTMRVSPDYDRELAVAVFLGERPGTGFALKVRKVTAADGRLTVHVDTVEPTGTLDRTGGPTSPFQVITLRRSDLPPDLAEPLQVEVMP
jgi:hypothetical protein